jgi:hypothetical protein
MQVPVMKLSMATSQFPQETAFERLCRYTAKPPLAADRLEFLPDGKPEQRSKMFVDRSWNPPVCCSNDQLPILTRHQR